MRSLTLLIRAPIIAGALRGRWWLPAGGGKMWRVLGGTYEPEQTDLFSRHVGPDDVVLDLGAHTGYYTLLASRLVGRGGRVFAFEPHPRNAWFLRQHARLNGCRNVEVVEGAAYDRTGVVRFRYGAGSGTGQVADQGAVGVKAVRIDDFVQQRGIVPSVIKVDVEGGERPVLEGARETLLRDRPIVFLSTHGLEQAGACQRILASLDYRTAAVAAGAGERDLLCIPAERFVAAPPAVTETAGP